MTTMTNPGRPRTAPKRRSRTVRRLVIVLIVLVGLLVVADFGAAAIAEHEVAKRARTQFGLSDDPDVKIGGFSFLLQAFSGEYQHVTVDAEGVPMKDLHDVKVHLDLNRVHAPLGDLISGNTDAIRVDQVDGKVTVKASDVTAALTQQDNPLATSLTRLTIDPASKAQVNSANAPEDGTAGQTADPKGTSAGARICGTVDIAGQSTDLCVFGIISLVTGKINFAPNRLEIRNALVNATLPRSLQDQVMALFRRINLDPSVGRFKITATAVTVTTGELAVEGTTENLTLNGSSA